MSPWTAQHVAAIRDDEAALPRIALADVARVSATIDIWDAWPVQDADGRPSALAGDATLWMALASPRFPDPDERHGHARIHLFRKDAGGWTHLGPAMPDGFSPGSREWSGSAVLGEDRRTLTLYFTATGLRGEPAPTFAQRIYRAEASLRAADANGPVFEDWRGLTELFVEDPRWYMASDAGSGSVGTIKAFRDPAFFQDPATGQRYLTFAGSDACSPSAFNGLVGLAVAQDDANRSWAIQPPIVTAAGLNNELERPHLIYQGGAYYLFWSTQRHVFDPAGPTGPTGLYGMVADRVEGPWAPLNGSGLVLANPAEAPAQGYSWLVLPDLTVISFIDNWGPPAADEPRRFGATFAPEVQLVLDGATARRKA
ncbi:levansucrase [Sphingomonas hengshuiensis]|uniref:Levansucrase n=1 Tax=Sphingomonas hengshuiensis TaxID=1609977 RepID=A0A7U5BFV0_9SPHN|nr:levansucrase [Sphingomonas hengshuiensis]